LGVPECERRGRVFKLLDVDGTLLPASFSIVGKLVSKIGAKAGIVVDERTKGGETTRKFASAHDLRRAFGQRWAAKVMPTVLRELMRHEDSGTTRSFYVGQNAEATAEAVWSAVGDTLGDTPRSSEKHNAKNTTKTSGDDRI
jgi:integrase